MERQERAGTAVTRRADPARGSWRAGRLGASRTAAEESGLTQYQQPLADRMESPGEAPGHISLHAGVAAERAARASLRTQIARLENELSQIVVDRFPFIPLPSAGVEAAGRGAPRLPDLGELERSRDRLAGRLQDLRGLASARAEAEARAREQLQRMRLEPGRYKFVRLPVSDLGQGGCGVWEVRPRLGLIGMLAGWWQLKLSSGCPLPGGRAPGATPLR